MQKQTQNVTYTMVLRRKITPFATILAGLGPVIQKLD